MATDVYHSPLWPYSWMDYYFNNPPWMTASLKLRIGCLTVVTAWQISLLFIRSFNADYSGGQWWVMWSPSLCRVTGCPPSHHFARPLDISVTYDSIVCIFFTVSELYSEMIILMLWQGKCFQCRLPTKSIFKWCLNTFCTFIFVPFFFLLCKQYFEN